MAKFISKSANLHIILKPGVPAQPITGTPPVPTLSVRFQDGIVDIKDEELIDLMQNHSGFDRDFILAADEAHDPYAGSRQSSEPAHIMTEVKFGTPVKKAVSGKLGNVNPDTARLIKEQAAELAKQMLPQMVKSTIEELIRAQEAGKEKGDENPQPKSEEAPKNKGGRPPKAAAKEK